jgi:hypothetical protein
MKKKKKEKKTYVKEREIIVQEKVENIAWI